MSVIVSDAVCAFVMYLLCIAMFYVLMFFSILYVLLLSGYICACIRPFALSG